MVHGWVGRRVVLLIKIIGESLSFKHRLAGREEASQADIRKSSVQGKGTASAKGLR